MSTPYMVLNKSNGFSCAHCKHLHIKGDEFHCDSRAYQKFAGTSLLKGKDGKPLEDATLACSNWFEPQ